MKIDTGKGFIGVWALLGIWSVSALTSLPGLAISPILGDLSTIFKDATELDIQLLTNYVVADGILMCSGGDSERNRNHKFEEGSDKSNCE